VPTWLDAVTENGGAQAGGLARQLTLTGLAAKHIAQDLAENFATRDLSLIRAGRPRLPGNVDLEGTNNHGLDAPLSDPFLQFSQDLAQNIAAGDPLFPLNRLEEAQAGR
jgi:hypothetical protein